MPPPHKRAKQAKLQQSSGDTGFNSGIIETISEASIDPSYVYEASDSDVADLNESDDNDWAFSFIDDMDEACEISDIEKEASKFTKFWNEKFDFKKVAGSSKALKLPTRAMPTYSRMGRTSQYKRQKATIKASKGCTSIKKFFSKQQARSTSPEVVERLVDLLVTQKTTFENFVKDGGDNRTYPTAVWLDPTADDEAEPVETPVSVIVEKLISEAKKFKSFGSLMHLHAVKSFIQLRDGYKNNLKVLNPVTQASITVAKSIGKGLYFARKIRKLFTYIQHFKTLPPINSGKHHAHPTLLNNERILQAVRRYLSIVANGEITPLQLMKHVNEEIISGLGLDLGKQNISESTARCWLIKLGYALKEARKGMYFDGHERQDVVEYCENFLKDFLSYERLRYSYTDEDLEPVPPVLIPEEQLHIPIFHDKSIFCSNDLQHRVWIRDGHMPLRKKGQGRAIHVSDFIVEQTGRLVMSEAEIHTNEALPPSQRLPWSDAREIIYPGKNNDGWWTNERFIAQVQKAIRIFERMFPNAVGEFVFDQSSAHGAFAKDALIAKELNVNPGGKPRDMRDTIIPMDNPDPAKQGLVQSMKFPKDLPPNHPYYAFKGQHKGMQVILEERGLLDILRATNSGKIPPGECKFCKSSRETQERLLQEAQVAAAGGEEPEGILEDALHASTSTTCCLRKALECQQDFRDEKPLLQQIIENASHKCYFLPKFHCKLNPIEMYWGWTKIRVRVASDGTFLKAKELVPEILNSCPKTPSGLSFENAGALQEGA
ncbi:hypothetical protein M422DRAFT_249876 [Sphaerobolus stellatus SS14]|uniref:Uncharacterized protein n=1 Tax=Sphaerobolus stellatus (strain SS14) TaxID=990650 RepID=A0A0C9VHH8_SPHS4|nr:hypothetical protein M422DRAFT_249876 [Sphaerobolus stellatus SS14]